MGLLGSIERSAPVSFSRLLVSEDVPYINPQSQVFRMPVKTQYSTQASEIAWGLSAVGISVGLRLAAAKFWSERQMIGTQCSASLKHRMRYVHLMATHDEAVSGDSPTRIRHQLQTLQPAHETNRAAT